MRSFIRSAGRRTRLATRSFLALGLALGLAACSDSGQGAGEADGASAPGTLERARAAKSIRIGFANEAPYAYLDIATGRLTGEAPEIARVVLAGLGITEVEGVLTEFGSLIPGLKAKRFDIIAAGMYVLPERCRQIAFSNPTYSVGDGFAVAKGNPKKLHGYPGIARQPDLRLGVVTGAVQTQYARGAGVPDAQVVTFPEAPSALEGLMAGRIDAYAGTRLTINYLLGLNPSENLETAAPFSEPLADGKPIRGYGAFGFRKEEVELVQAFNAELVKLIGSNAHLELVRPFGFTSHELPGRETAQSLCRG